MSFLGGGLDAAIDSARLPPPPARPQPPERGFWGTTWDATIGGLRGIDAGIVKIAAGAAELEHQASEALPGAAARAERRRTMGIDTQRVAASLRDFERELRPDAFTASEAEKVVYGLTSFFTELGIGAVAAGPVGAAVVAGGAEAGTATDDLQRQGVDDKTARIAGAVQGGVAAAGAVIPLYGSTLARTAGLYAVGAGSNIAQVAATRAILQHADYGKIAEQFDPWDKTLWALSLGFPLPFTGYGAWRNIQASRKAAPRSGTAPPRADRPPGDTEVAAAPSASPEAVDAAMVYNLTLHADEVAARPTTAAPPVEPAPAVASAPAGVAAEVVTERGMAAPVRYRLAEASDLVTSHGDDLSPNAAFPAELQPRDRTRAASADQVARIENAIDPEQLGASRKASDGAPIVGPDAVVESGNARTIALRRAYGSGKAENYRAWLAENAQRFGLTREDVAGMQRPVLVRERLGEIDRAEFARQANESAVAALSPVEQARADASRMTDLSGLVANDDGTISLGRSREFVRGFMQGIGPTERGALMQADGQLSQAGQHRIRNAVFAKAYGDADLVAMLTESTDSNVRNILVGLLRAAPDVARLQDLIAAGARQPIDVSADIVAAVRELDRLRQAGVTVDQFLAQGDMLGGALPPELNNLLVGLRENARSPRRVAEMVRQLVDAVDALGDPRQASILDGASPGRADLTADVVERMRGMRDEPVADASPSEGPASDALDRSIADRVGALEAQQPDMVIRIDEQGQRVTLADEMNRIRREAREGTDTELGALDADLLRVAADCALSTGAP